MTIYARTSGKLMVAVELRCSVCGWSKTVVPSAVVEEIDTHERECKG